MHNIKDTIYIVVELLNHNSESSTNVPSFLNIKKTEGCRINRFKTLFFFSYFFIFLFFIFGEGQ